MSSSYSIDFSSGVTVSLLWTDFESVSISKNLEIQYFDNGKSYTIFAIDGTSILYKCLIYKSAYESGATYPSDYSSIQNAIDRVNFETNYKITSNLPYKFTITQTQSYHPDTSNARLAPSPALVDAGNALITRSSINSDEGTFSDSFLDPNLLVPITGTITVINGYKSIIGTGTFFTQEVGIGTYIKIVSQNETALTQVAFVTSDTQLVLVSGYNGSSGTGSAEISSYTTNTPSDGYISIVNNSLILNSGATNGNITSIAKQADYAPLSFRVVFNISQRILNQVITVGFVDDPLNIGAQVSFVFDGIDNSKFKFRTSSGLGGTVKDTTFLIPGNALTSSLVAYTVFFDGFLIRIFANGVFVGTYNQQMPYPYEVLQLAAVIENKGTVTPTIVNFASLLYASYDSVHILSDQGAPINSPNAWPVKVVSSNGTTDLAIGSEGRLRVGVETQLFYDPVENHTINTNLWVQSFSGMMQDIFRGSIILNHNNSLVSGNYSILQSSKRMLFLQDFGLYAHFRAQIISQPGAINEAGFGIVSGTSPPTDGAFFRFNNSEVNGIISFMGVETATPTLNIIVDSASFYSFNIYIYADYALFQINTPGGIQIVNTILNIPNNQPSITSTAHLPFFARVYNSTTLTLPASTNIGIVTIQQTDIATNKKWSEQMVSQQKGAYTNPVTYSQTANYDNNAAPVIAVLSNTVPSYTTLGGQFAFSTPAGSETDYALFGFQSPDGNQLVITSIRIATYVTGAQSFSSPILIQWGLGINCSDQSLATLGSNPSIRVAIGMQQVPKTAQPGDAFDPSLLECTPISPFVVDPGRYFHVILKVITGSVTTNQIIRGTCFVEGYFE